MSQVRQMEGRVRELSLQLAAKTRDLDLAQDALRKLRGEYSSTRKDAEGMLQVSHIVFIYVYTLHAHPALCSSDYL